MKTEVILRVEDVLSALGIEGLQPTYNEETVEVRAEIDEEAITDELIEAGKAQPVDSGNLDDMLDQQTITDLSAAIRRGDTKEAEFLLDRLVADDQMVTEWVQQGRYSRKARADQQTLRQAIEASIAA